jgi:hypothetical protein
MQDARTITQQPIGMATVMAMLDKGTTHDELLMVAFPEDNSSPSYLRYADHLAELPALIAEAQQA